MFASVSGGESYFIGSIESADEFLRQLELGLCGSAQYSPPLQLRLNRFDDCGVIVAEDEGGIVEVEVDTLVPIHIPNPAATPRSQVHGKWRVV